MADFSIRPGAQITVRSNGKYTVDVDGTEFTIVVDVGSGIDSDSLAMLMAPRRRWPRAGRGFSVPAPAAPTDAETLPEVEGRPRG